MAESDQLAKLIGDIMLDRCPPEVVEDAEGGWAAALWARLDEAGLTSVGVPEDQGGSGGDLLDAATVLRIAAQFAAPLPLLGTLLLAPWLSHRFGLAHHAGPAAVYLGGVLKATAAEGGWTVTGQLRDVPYGHLVDHVLALAHSPADDTAVLCSLPSASLPWENGQNLAGEPRDRAGVVGLAPASCAVRQGGDLDGIVRELRDREALGQSLQMVGAMEKVQRITIAYATEREQFGRAIGAFQAIRQLVADLAGEVAVSAAAVRTASGIVRDQGSAPFAIAAARVRTASAATSVARMAHQVHGAMGYTREHPLHQYTRRLWTWRDEGLTEARWTTLAGERALGDGPDAFWEKVTG